MTKVTVYMISGTRRTGKDKLADKFMGVQSQDKKYNDWIVYSEGRSWVSPEQKIYRMALADALRDHVYSLTGIKQEIAASDAKDQILVDGVLLRTYMINLAMKKRYEHPGYWCKILNNKIEAVIGDNEVDRESQFYKDEAVDTISVLITDNRFGDEAKYLEDEGHKVITMRVFRSDVPIPSISGGDSRIPEHDTEHQLDHVKADYLLLINVPGELDAAVKLYPQYSKYVPVGIISMS